jgi:K+-transporting ATPase ATPase A chain
MQTGEVIFGGVGAGLYGILLYAILAVFIAGLMVGRTPEYLGKKIEGKEVKMAMLAFLASAFSVLVFAAFTSVLQFDAPQQDAKGHPVPHSYWNPPGPPTANFNNAGPHGFIEDLYAYSSAAANNGSAFAGLNANTPWYNLTLGLAMLMGRFLFLLPLLAAAGALANKRKVAATSGTFPTSGPMFAGLLVGTVLLLGALTFFPALALGPLVEHFFMMSGKLVSVLVLPFAN